MSDLAKLSLAIGCTLAALCAPCVLSPKSAGEWIRRFPRNRLAAWILTTIDIVWIAWLIFHLNIGRVEVPILNRVVDFEALKGWLFILTPTALFLIAQFMDELLATRALGGLLLLLPAPLLTLSRWHESPYRLVMVVLAYIMVVVGTALVLNPYLFRKMSSRCSQDEELCRTVGTIGMTFAAFIIFLAAKIY
jgi:hypothetical protein